MKLRRNDPCPCGSGLKYKKCCEARDVQNGAGGATSRRQIVLETAKREQEWQADVVPLPVGFKEGSGHRPVAVMLTAGGLVLRSEIRDRMGGEPDQVAEAIEREVVRAAQEVGSLPARVAVRFAEIVEPLRSRLEARDTQVVERHELDDVEDAARGLIEHLVGREAVWPPACFADSWSAWRLPPASVKKLFTAAAGFWGRAPWRVLDNEQAPEATFPSGRSWTAAVMGMAGQQFGLVLYSDASDLHAIASSESPAEGFGRVRGRVISLTFDPVKQLPSTMTVEARVAGWKVASPSAFPILMTLNTPGGGVSEREIEELTVLLQAVPDFADTFEQEMLNEQRTGRPVTSLEWRDETTGLVLRYDGEAAEERARTADLARILEAQASGDHEESRFTDQRLQLDAHVQAAFEEVGPDGEPEEYLQAIFRRAPDLIEGILDEPRPEAGGLSHRQVADLLDADWTDRSGPIRLMSNLPTERLVRSDLLTNAQTILDLASEYDGLPATQAGNLSVAVVRDLVGRCRLDRHRAESLLALPRVIEADVWPIHFPRILLELSGVLRRRKGRFRITSRGRALASPAASGELFALLVRTMFRDFNLAYAGGPEWSALQRQAAYTLHRLGRLPVAWRTAGELLSDVVHPVAMHSAPRRISDLAALSLEIQVLEPLAMAGLLDTREEPDSRLRFRRSYRVTTLFGDVFDFAF